MSEMNIILLLTFLLLISCSSMKNLENTEQINFHGLNFNDREYLIGDIEDNISSKYFEFSQTDKCNNYVNSKKAIDLLYKDKKLISIFVGYGNKSVVTSHGIKNGMTDKDVYENYKDFKVIKEHSEGAGDSQDDFTYKIHDKENNLKNEIVFDIVNGKVMGMHVSKKGLDGYICDE